MAIHILYGNDEFSLHEFLSSMRERVNPPDLRDSNITVFDGTKVSLDQLVANCNSVPFLAEKRMVIVEGLLTLFEARVPSRARNRVTDSKKPTLGQWEGLSEYLSGIPPTTELVLVDGPLSNSNLLLVVLRQLAKIQIFRRPTGRNLNQWIHHRAMTFQVDVEPMAVNALAAAIGNNLRVIDLELKKLSLYRWGHSIRHQDVQDLVAPVKEANIFAAVDAVLERNERTSYELIHQLVEEGRSPASIIAMVSRQVRLLLLAKDLKAQGVRDTEIGRRLSLTDYPMRKILEQGRKITIERLAVMHRQLLEADLTMKTSGADELLVLDILIAELASGSLI